MLRTLAEIGKRQEIMRLLILYFSGTGNTHYVAQYIMQRLKHLPIEIQVQSIEQLLAEELSKFDVLAIGFPVYECDSPLFFRKYLDRLPRVEGKGVFVFCTKGAFAGNAPRCNLKRLMMKGYIPLGAACVGMPGSDGLPFMQKESWIVRLAQHKNYDKLKTADHLAQRMESVLCGIANGKAIESYRSKLSLSISGLLLDWLWKLLYQIFSNYIKRKFWADEHCNGCGFCVKICPAKNIELNNKRAFFLDHCYICMRCIHQCPKEAIQIGQATVGKFRWRGPKEDFNPLNLQSQSKKVNVSED
ncbi:MAG: EFR1 family ferrodoxin [Actinobacteria bacterium]|nr:EFR1 family ferrodoxin [Actinomycetota bacterium]